MGDWLLFRFNFNHGIDRCYHLSVECLFVLFLLFHRIRVNSGAVLSRLAENR